MDVSTSMRRSGTYMRKEKYREQLYDFQVDGFVVASFLRRLSKFKDTGIVNKWIELLETIYNSSFTQPPYCLESGRPSKALLEGNAVIIFVVFVEGSCMSLLLFLEIFANSIIRLFITYAFMLRIML